MKKRWVNRVFAFVIAFAMVFQAAAMDVSAADHTNTSILNFSMDSDLVKGYVVSVDGKTDFTVQDGCIVLEGGFTHKDIPIQIQMAAHEYYEYCICSPANTLGQYNTSGVSVQGTLSSSEHWDTEYSRDNSFEHDAAVDITLEYGPYSNVDQPVYGKRTVRIYIARYNSSTNKPEGNGGYYSLPLLFVADSATASASVTQSVDAAKENPVTLTASWNLGANTGITASYQWYKKENGTYTKIDGATAQQYVPAATGDYKVDVSLTVDSLTAGVQKGTYTASAETSVTKSSSDAKMFWEYKSGSYVTDKTVTVGDDAAIGVYTKTPGKFVIKKDGTTVKEITVDSSQLQTRVTDSMGTAAVSMDGEYTWDFTPDNSVFYNTANGTAVLHVNKIASNASVSMSSNISTSDYKGTIEMSADVPGTFTFTTESRTQSSEYTSAGTQAALNDLGTLVPSGTAVGDYELSWVFVPENTTDYAEESGTLEYTVDEAKCDIRIEQTTGGTVAVNGDSADLRGTVGETYEILVTPAASSSSIYSAVESVMVNGEAIEEDSLTRNADGSVSASFTVPSDGTGKTYTISAAYDYKKLVLKNNQTYYLDPLKSLSEKEADVWAAVLDTANSVGITTGDSVTVQFYMGIDKDVYGKASERWDDLNAIAINLFGSDLHNFGSQDTEKIRISIPAYGLIGEATMKVISRTGTVVNVDSDKVTVSDTGDANAMYEEMVQKIGASVNEYDLYTGVGAEISGAELAYTDTNGTAIDWSQVKAGDVISVKVAYAGTEEYSSSSKTVSVYVRPGMEISGVKKTYTGEAISLSADDFTAVPAAGSVAVTVAGIEGYYKENKEAVTEFVKADTYYVKLNLEDAYGTFVSDYVSVTIEPAKLTVVSAAAENRVYDGTKNVNLTDAVLSGIKGSDAVYTDCSDAAGITESKDAGSYDSVTINGIKLTGEDAVNYKLADSASGASVTLYTPVVISPRQITIENAAVKASKEYDGNVVAEITDTGTLSWKYSSDDVNIVKGNASYDNADAGTDKEVTFSGFALSGEDAGNYVLEAQPAGVTADITPKELIVSAEVAEKQYNGTDRETEIISAEITNLIPDDEVYLDLTNASAKYQGKGNPNAETDVYAVCQGIVLKGEDAGNYQLTQPFTVLGKIVNNYTALQGMDYTVESNDWINSTFEVYAEDGYKLSFGWAVPGTWTDTLEASWSNKDGEDIMAFYVMAPNGDISRRVEESFKIDMTAPTGSISIEKNEWKSFLNKVTLGLFFSETYDVTITAADQETLSGVKTIEYYEYVTDADGEGLSMNADGTLPVEESKWKLYTDVVRTEWEEEKTYIYYVRITDNAGNTTYLCSEEGIEYDVTVPVMSGVQNQGSYYTTQVLTAEDRNLKTVTLNGDIVTSPVTLEGNKNAVYIIAAEDKAGNITVYTVTMKPISEISDLLKDLTEDTVTSDDTELIDKVRGIVDAEDKEDAVKEELDALQEILDTCDALEKRLEEVHKTLEEAETLTVPVKEENLTLEDKDDLEEGKEILEHLLEDFGGNFTENETEEIQKELDRVNELIESIEAAEAVMSDIEDLPDTVKTDDEDGTAEAAIRQAKESYDALTDLEKSLVKSSCTAKVEKLLEMLTDYRIISGAGQKWRRKTTPGAVFKANGPVRKFVSVEVDGSVVASGNYAVTKGSTVVTFDIDYLHTLAIGEHAFRVNYTDGSTDVVKFEIKMSYQAEEKAQGGDADAQIGGAEVQAGDVKAADTADVSNISLWLAMLAVSMVEILVVLKKRRIR